MARTPEEMPGPEGMEIFDEASHGELVCRVCGALVPRTGEFARVHWDWHEASNGA